MAVENLITEHIDIWTSAVKTKSASGRGSSKKLELYGVKKLRELILELAVRGKLVPQHPNDEPASVLLKRIAQEKAQLIKEKKIKKSKTLQTLSPESLPRIPESWTWSHMQDITEYVQRGKGPKYAEEGSVRVISQKCVQNSGFDIEPARYIEEESLEKYQDERFLRENDLLWNSTGTGTVGRVNVLPSIKQKSLVADSHVTVVRPLIMNSRYIWCILMAPGVQARIDPFHEQSLVSGSTKQVELNTSSVITLPIPVAPIAEQHRIVAKVDELMALCDQLEQQTEASIEAHQVLVTTLLDTLTNSADADELMQNWARISEHFDTLFTTEESIDQLKQTILQLAVMGALSQPLNSDTPIDLHLDNILEQQKQLATAKEYSLIEAEVLKAKTEISNNRVVLKARCFCNFITKGTTPSKNELLETGDVPFLKVYNIVNNELDFDYRPIFISNEVHTSKLKRSIAHPGDVIMNIVGPPLGKVAVLSEHYPQWNMNQALAVFKPVSSVFNRYLYYVLSCELTLRSVLSEVKGTAGQDNLSLEQCRDLLVPIMSIQEQQRLVCLVDSLWDYCDRLKKRMKSSQKTQLHLTDAVTGQAV
ncbi:restriction endonuclease subunit S [Vibrio parahaemolyticus]|uniref:restriction endonuclease subunit S n=1 Tax=Vibrio vulnificus TaxID=672 RepID=UPI001A19BF98|nr:restriction endonuclease subunit S [Vibrio parahaemolyticus]HAT8527854.1 restriction endonuclease subunit S [Vibrio vulnificus]HAU8282869.1 restriction endonuclease subunit S [Vibrio vulnificus]HBN6094104.1 restriction endonuclease subunit S [Vibrio parahaemolyticus]HBN6184012.1 restriction endonuclease subunit S [Vibrio parahaemolyticus]